MIKMRIDHGMQYMRQKETKKVKKLSNNCSCSDLWINFPLIYHQGSTDEHSKHVSDPHII